MLCDYGNATQRILAITMKPLTHPPRKRHDNAASLCDKFFESSSQPIVLSLYGAKETLIR